MWRSVRIRFQAFLVITFFLAGCSAATLREAQDHFNNGAEFEARALSADWSTDSAVAGPVDAVSTYTEYKMAYDLASEAIRKDESDLKNDGLLGTAYMVRTLAYWRMTNIDSSGLEAADAQAGDSPPVPGEGGPTPRQQFLIYVEEVRALNANGSISLGTRDRVLIEAMRGFHDHDGGLAAEKYEDAQRWFDSALKRMEEALDLDGVPANHPVRAYIRAAQLRTVSAWNRAGFECILRRGQDCPVKRIELGKMIKEKTLTYACPLITGDKPTPQVAGLLSEIGLPTLGDSCSDRVHRADF